MSEADVAKLAELLKKFRIAMLTTLDGDGSLISRPMAVQEAEFDGDLWFFAERESRQVTQLRHDANANVALSSSDAWVSVSGQVEVVEDVEKAKQLWNKAVEAWFPNGPEDPGVVLLKLHADGAEFWDSPGSRVTTLLSYAKSRITGERPDIGENERVDL